MITYLNKSNFVFKFTRVAFVAMVILMMLGVQASACVSEHKYKIGDRVWNDLDKNGAQDWDYKKHCFAEPGIPDVTVKLYKCDNTFVESTTTNSRGYYKFENVERGYYYVLFVLPEDYTFSPKDKTDSRYDSDAYTNGKTDCITVSRDICTVDAGMYCEPTPEPAGVGNYVWNDLNLNGLQESGEIGMEGVTVKLYTCEGELVNTTETDEDGYYEFDDLEAGSYYIQFVSPSGYVFTTANQGDEDEDSDAETGGVTSCFTLNAGDYYNVVDAGLHSTEQEIPEFPTVAIPMLAIVGLAFVFGRRKE